ncbi:hypothetical protein JB92DRAFT_3132519 [Gautieria morchelliformis]|nr:hypothetical protein JB92DRAFT_3132519 [Gautieria morchelliformis]
MPPPPGSSRTRTHSLCQPANPASSTHAHAAWRRGLLPSRPGPGEEKDAMKNGTAGLVNGTGAHDTLKAPLARRQSPVPYPPRAPPYAPPTTALLPIWGGGLTHGAMRRVYTDDSPIVLCALRAAHDVEGLAGPCEDAQ